MKRRDLLTAGGFGTLIGVAGCLEQGNEAETDDDGDGEEEPAEERAFPEHPSSLDEETALEYVRESEEVYQHNQFVDGRNLSIGTDCPPVLHHEASEGYYVSTVCWVTTWDGGGVGEGHSEEVLYLVTPDEAVRIEPERHEYDDPYVENGQSSSEAQGVWLSNFDDESHALSVRVVHDDRDAPIDVLEETYDLPPGDGRIITNVAGIADYYEIRAELPDGSETSERVRISVHDWGSEMLAAVHVTPGGDVTSGEISFEKR